MTSKKLNNRQDIEAWLQKYNIYPHDFSNPRYTIITDPENNNQLAVNVNGNVHLSSSFTHVNKHGALTELPVQFNNVSGDFKIELQGLTTLRRAPRQVGGDFSCAFNNLTSLEFCPDIVHGDFHCGSNTLKTIEHGPSHVGGNFDCGHNLLTSLKGCPQTINGNFICRNNHLNTFEFCPHLIEGMFYGQHNRITDLEYLPQKIRGEFSLKGNLLLGKFENISDFEELYTEHLRIKNVKSEKLKLEQHFGAILSPSKTQLNKI